MRTGTRRALITTLGVIAVGAVVAMPAAASSFETFPIDHAYPVVNVCTGEWTTLTLTGAVHVREQLTPGGPFHVLERFDVTWTTDDGFAGTARQVGTVTDRKPGTSDDLVAHVTSHFVGRDGSGAVAQTRDLLVLNLREGDEIVHRQRLDARCTGHG